MSNDLNISMIFFGTDLGLQFVAKETKMGKTTKLLTTAFEYYALFIVTFGYWIEMAEDMEVNDNIEKIGKHALVIAKLLFFK